MDVGVRHKQVTTAITMLCHVHSDKDVLHRVALPQKSKALCCFRQNLWQRRESCVN